MLFAQLNAISELSNSSRLITGRLEGLVESKLHLRELVIVLYLSHDVCTQTVRVKMVVSMKLSSVSTKLVTASDDLYQVLSDAIPVLTERSIVVIASKIIATTQNRFVEKRTGTKAEKYRLIERESEYYLPATASHYEVMLTVKGNWMFANAGIDESNANGRYLLWPDNPQAAAESIWHFLRKKFHRAEIGVTVSDSRSLPLNWGVTGHAIAHCGFNPLYSYIGKPDLYGRPMKMEQLNVAQAVTAAGALVMGEGAEQTPIAVASELPDSIEFVDHPPTPQELQALHISLEDDIFAPLLTAVAWQKGGVS